MLSFVQYINVKFLSSRGHGDEQHVRGSEEDVGAVAHPDVPQHVHEEDAGGHQHGEQAEGQLAPQRPADGEVAHQQGGDGA